MLGMVLHRSFGVLSFLTGVAAVEDVNDDDLVVVLTRSRGVEGLLLLPSPPEKIAPSLEKLLGVGAGLIIESSGP